MSFQLFLQTAASSSQSFLMSVLPFVLIIGIFYFFIIRPQNKKQKETENMLASLQKGDKVVTIGGIHGVISSVKEKTVIVKVDDNTKLEFTRSAIANVVRDKPVAAGKKDKKAAASAEPAAAAPAAAESASDPADAETTAADSTGRK